MSESIVSIHKERCNELDIVTDVPQGSMRMTQYYTILWYFNRITEDCKRKERPGVPVVMVEGQVGAYCILNEVDVIYLKPQQTQEYVLKLMSPR